MSSRVVHVEIHGQRYAVRSELEPQYVAELAGFLDDKMRAASRELATTDTTRVAVIAALNIAEELFRTLTESEGADLRMRSRAAEIERLVDAVLDEAKARVVNQ